MKKSIFSVFSIIVCCTVLIFSFQNCGGDFGIIDNLETTSQLAPSEPLELSSDVTQVQMKLNSNDEMLLPEENMGLDIDLEKQNLQLTDSNNKALFQLNRNEVNEIILLFRLIRKIKLSDDKCKIRRTDDIQIHVMEMDDIKPEAIVVNTKDEKNIILGQYVNCKARYDLAKEERRVLKRILLRIILSRTQINCPQIGTADELVCGPDSYLVKRIDNNFCEAGHKCIQKPKQCLNETLILPPICPPNTNRIKTYDNGCLSGYRCEASHQMCPMLPQVAIRCHSGYKSVQVFDKNKCVVGLRCQKINSCPVFVKAPFDLKKEKECINDGGKYFAIKDTAGCVVDFKCHKELKCPKNIKSIFNYSDSKQCMVSGGKYTPVKNDRGCVTNFNCVGRCLKQQYERRPANWQVGCEQNGGAVVPDAIVNGCKKPSYCKRPNRCPIPFVPHYNQEKDRSCLVQGGQYLPIKENGCVVSYECQKAHCPAYTLSPDFKTSCYKDGGKIIFPKPISNCPMPPRCERPNKCKGPTPVPSERMLNRCKVIGGNLILKKDSKNCPVKFICEGSKEPCPALVPSYNLLKNCKDKGGTLKGVKNTNECTTGYKCEKDTLVCPAITHVFPVCKANEKVKALVNRDGCVVGNKCVPKIDDPISCPGITMVYPVCAKGYKVKQKFNNMGCMVGYYCYPDQKICPQLLVIPPYCEHGTKVIKSKDGCNTGYTCVEPVNCPQVMPPAPGFCGDEEKTIPIINKDGCTTGFKCGDPLVACSDDIPEKPLCGENANAQMSKNSNGCFAGWTCKRKIDRPYVCPIIPMGFPMCLPPSQLIRVKDVNNCITGYKCKTKGPIVGGIPKTCSSWFDGCNTCSVSNGKLQACTKRACFVQEKPRCLKY